MREEVLLCHSVSKESPHFLWNSKGSLTWFINSTSFPKYPSPLERTTEFPATSKEEPRFPRLKSRWGSIALLRLERNGDVPISPQEKAGIYLTLEGNPGALSHFESHLIPHPLEIRPDMLPPIRMSAENQLTAWREFSCPGCLSKKSPRSQIELGWRPETPLTTWEESRDPCLHTRWELTPCLKCHTQPKTHGRTHLELRWGPLPLHQTQGSP